MAQALTPPRLLIVDDNSDNLVVIRLFLENGGYDLDEARNGLQAVELFAANAYALIFMDLEMPILDGYEATRRIRAMEREHGRPAVPILALTAHALDEHRQRCQEAGFTGFLAKPVRKAAMLDTLLSYLGGGKTARVRSAAEAADAPPDPGRLKALLPLFFDSSRQALDTAREALGRGDLTTAGQQGHRLKGSAGSYGFSELGRAGAALETACLTADAVTAATSLEWAASLLAKARLDWSDSLARA
ncbi:response regulator [Solidesulfovibrio sp.]